MLHHHIQRFAEEGGIWHAWQTTSSSCSRPEDDRTDFYGERASAFVLLGGVNLGLTGHIDQHHDLGHNVHHTGAQPGA
jgi:hypothetical protein